MNNKLVNPDQLLRDPHTTNASLTEVLVQQYYPYIFRLAYSIVRDAAEAEDVAQDTFVVALVRIDDCEPDTNFKAWLSTIAVNKCRDILRKRKTRFAFANAWKTVRSITGYQPTPEESAVRNETDERLWAAVDRLREKHRLPIVMRYLHNLSIREIAAILETKEGTIHSRLHYACKQLAVQLELGDDISILLKGEQP